MPTVIQRTIYTFDELTEKSKETARGWYRNASAGDDFFAEYVIDDAAECADILGIDLRQTRRERMDKTIFYAPTIYWSGFCSQGDGASFVGEYRYAKGGAQAIRKHAPKDAELHRIADALQEVQKRHFYKLVAKVTQSGRYSHSGAMFVDVTHADDIYRDVASAQDDIGQALRDFADWIYRRLEESYDWENSNENVDDCIIANQYTFDENGRREG